MTPLFYPPVRYTPSLVDRAGMSVRELCDRAGTACKASGDWVDRRVSWAALAEGDLMTITAEPGLFGAVNIGLPVSPKKAGDSQFVARQLLLAMAYGVFDGVARESVRGVAWPRLRAPAGRPRMARAKSGAERQRAWRERHLGGQ